MIANRSFGFTLDRMNRVLDQALSNDWTTQQLWVPAIDVVEKKDAYVLHVELPGVDSSQVDISFEKNVLTIRGTKTSTVDASKEGEMRIHAVERVHGAFERSVRLPQFVDGERISADFTNGLLTVTVPKAEAAQPRKITIGGVKTAAVASEN
jgi:HSP20 family protein